MSRRQFIKACALTSLGVLVGCRSNPPKVQYTLNESHEIPINRGDFDEARYVVIEHPSSRYPIGVFQLSDNDFVASLMECTHQSCELSVKGGIYICPCHGSRFGADGRVIKGPAENNLKTYSLRTTENQLFIKLY